MTKLVYISEVIYDPNTVLTVGTFDGVHEGHKTIISNVVKKAKNKDARSAVITFDPHPREILNAGSDKIKLLTTIQERAEILSSLGVDFLIVIPFTRDFSLLTASEFLEDVIYKKIGVSEYVIGYDHQFGRNREGTIDSINETATRLGFDVHVVKAHEIKDVTISSSLVRKELELNGNIILADNYLGQPYKLSGSVIHGDKRGRLIGYPTANLRMVDARKIIPKNGVYAVDVMVENDKTTYRGMMNIGTRPTFTENDNRAIEVHILDFDSDIYGKVVTVHFLKRIRDEKKFSGIEPLVDQLNLDRISCLEV
jgi:riboflavin kinase/FMN adenylyltransferase